LHPLAMPLTLDWLQDRFDGHALPASGITTVWSTAASLGAVRDLLSLAWSTATAVFGRRL
jgi:hypothetical protein